VHSRPDGRRGTDASQAGDVELVLLRRFPALRVDFLEERDEVVDVLPGHRLDPLQPVNGHRVEGTRVLEPEGDDFLE
jgi:hypothetical protein